jgi:hypothetical protein
VGHLHVDQDISEGVIALYDIPKIQLVKKKVEQSIKIIKKMRGGQ